jgi:hypothetical protein
LLYEEFARILDKFPKCNTKILLEDFNAEVGSEVIFKPTIGNESLHKINNDNWIRVVNIKKSENLRAKITVFWYCSIHKYTWTSPDGESHNQIDHILIDRRRHSSVLDVRSLRAADWDTDHYLEVAKFKEWLAVNRQDSHQFHMERFYLKWLHEVESKEKYRFETSSRFAATASVV